MTDEPRRLSPRVKRLASAGVVLALIGVGQVLRDQSGVQLDPESLQAFVKAQGWLAPIIFVLIVSLRQFFLVPSALVLTAGGLLFGAVVGSVLGAAGLFVSTLFLFAIARGVAGETTRKRLAERFPRIDRSVGSTGPLLVFLTLAYPLGAITAVALAAGFSSIRVGPLAAAAALGGVVRASTYSFVGSTLLDVGSRSFWIAVVLLAVVTLLPLVHRGTRRRLFQLPD